MNITEIIQNGVIRAVKALYDQRIAADDITMNSTRREFEGDYTVVVFPFTKMAKKKPEAIGQELGEFIVREVEEIQDFNVIKGFLNLVVADHFWLAFLDRIYLNEDYGRQAATGQKVMVEFASPNTNKPLHLGHIRNILLGWSIYKIYSAIGYEVVRVQIVNDRGIAICKSMVAWKKFAGGATPESTGIKSDHFVGDYYVRFEQAFQEEYKEWQGSVAGKAVYSKKAGSSQQEGEFFKDFKNTYFNEYSVLGGEAKEMLRRWEAGDAETIALWKKMNSWVYKGFKETYRQLGVSFDRLYYESDTYLLGRDTVEKGLQNSIFYRKADGSVWIDLTNANLDHKLVLRSDGTSVYMTQDLGTAQLRYRDFGVDRMIYVVGDEQIYHFQVLFEVLKRLGEPYAKGLYHLAYGLVDLPSGKMKSREGTVVDADDLIAEVVDEARKNSSERGEVAELSVEQREVIIQKVALAALKFFIVKVQPKKRMTFNPKESVDLQGQTGPYVQYSYVRINGVWKRAQNEEVDLGPSAAYPKLHALERELLTQLFQFPGLIQEAAKEYDPSLIANFVYALAKNYSKLWHELSIFDSEPAAKAFRLKLSRAIGNVLRLGMDLLGIEMPEKM